MGIEELLRSGDRCWVELGVARGPAATGATGGLHVEVTLVPSRRVCDARVALPGLGATHGVYAPIQTGDELLVAFPGADANRAVVIGSLNNGSRPKPADADGSKLLAMHPGGVELRDAPGVAANAIVHGGILPDLATYVTALDVFMTAISIAATAPQIAAAAVAFQAAVGTPSSFATDLAASAVPPGGGPPYATTTHKVTP